MIVAAHDRARQTKERRKENGGAPTGRTLLSVAEGKRKRTTRTRASEGQAKMGWWAAGPKGKVRSFSFFSFSNSFQIKSFQFKFKQNFSNFFIEFYKLFKLHTSNQNPCKDK
jgi:hypothetical protein